MAKALRDFSRANPHLVIKGGLADGSLLSPADLAALADLPPRDVLLARLAGALAAPLQQMAGLLQALPRNLAYGLSALKDQREAAGEGEPAAAERAPEPEAEAAVEAEAAPEPQAGAAPEPEAEAAAEPQVEAEAGSRAPGRGGGRGRSAAEPEAEAAPVETAAPEATESRGGGVT